jgi:outer membrane protein assembly factor BamA
MKKMTVPVIHKHDTPNTRIAVIRICFFTILLSLFPQLRAYCSADSVLVISDIMVLGNGTTKEYVVTREMSMHVGDTLTQQKIERDRNNIYNLGLFNKVDIEYAVQNDSAQLFVIVTERWYLIPFPIIGIKYRDPSKLYYGAGFIHKNFMGRNEKVLVNFCFGYDRWLSVGYSNPKIDEDGNVYMGGDFTVQKIHNLSTETGEYENSNIFASFYIGRRYGLYQTLTGSLSYEVWQVNNPMLHRTISPGGRDAFPSASLTYRYDTRDQREYTTDGLLVSLSAAKLGFGESDMDLSTFSYDLRKFLGFNKGSGFGMRTAGIFFTGGPIPPYKHVFFGYDERIRGYFYNVFEAENRIIASAELRIPILLPRYIDIDLIDMPGLSKLRYGIYFGIFADVGKIWSHNQVVSEQPWYSGAGFGLQFLLPYGFTIRTEGAFNNLGEVQGLIDFDTSF